MIAAARPYDLQDAPSVSMADPADALTFLGVADTGVGVVESVRAGLPTGVIERLAGVLDVGQQELLRLVAIAPATLTRRRRAMPARLSPQESDRVYRIAAALQDTVRLFDGDQPSARAWLKEPAKALGGQTPLAYLGTEVGAAEVHRLIARLELGIYP
jgi:putative toxin-antitoxin system antitoxin component (TIGR02293 family)